MIGQWLRDLDRILRGDATRLPALERGTIDIRVGGLSLVLIVLGMIYGACMGSFALFKQGGPTYLQVVASTLKVPALFILTLLITLPSLYVSNALVGSRLAIDSLVRLLVAALAVIVAVLASIGPIVAFFSASTTSYHFMVLVNVFVFGVSGSLGLTFLLQTLQRLTEAPLIAVRPPTVIAPMIEQTEATEETPDVPAIREHGALEAPEGQVFGPHVKTVFRCWVVLFGMVGAQMGWVLRPFIGNPNAPFTWFRGRDSNFFQGVIQSLVSLFS